MTKLVLSFRVVLSLCMIVSFCSCGETKHSGPTENSSSGLELRVMSFNIRCGDADDGENRWEMRREMLFDVIRDYQPDVVGLQEAMRFQIDQIRKALPEYGEIGVGRSDGKTKGEYAAILYRTERFNVDKSSTFWFSDTPEVPNSKHWGNTTTRICTWARLTEKKSSRSFYIYNVHLDHRSQPSREKSVVLLAKRISCRSHPDTVVVTGDFNAAEDNPVTLYMKGKYSFPAEDKPRTINPVPMIDTFRVLHPEATDVRTSHHFLGRRSGRGKIDYVFVRPDVKVLEASIDHTQYNGRYPSDHFPVTARIVIPATIKQ